MSKTNAALCNAYLIKGWVQAKGADQLINSAVDTIIGALSQDIRVDSTVNTASDFNFEKLETMKGEILKMKDLPDVFAAGAMFNREPTMKEYPGDACVSPADDKTVCLSESAENDDQPGAHELTGYDISMTDADEKALAEKLRGVRSHFTEDQKREIVRRRDDGQKFAYIAANMYLDKEKIEKWFYNNKAKIDQWRDKSAVPADDNGWPDPVKIQKPIAAVATVMMPRVDTPPDQLMKYQNVYIGKRDPDQPLTGDDWPTIKEMLKSYGTDYIAAQLQVKRTKLDFFIAEQSEGEGCALQS